MAEPQKPKLVRFSGSKSEINITAWLRLFEEVTSEAAAVARRPQTIISLLDNDALNWYARDIAGNNMQWAAIRAAMIARFENVLSPLVQAQRCYLQRDENIAIYFNKKMELLRKTPLTAKDMTDMLTEGVPSQYKCNLVSARLTTPEAWFETALQLEVTLKKNYFSTNKHKPSYGKPKPSAFMAASKDYKKSKFKKNSNTKPPSPCNICKRNGKTEWHWHRDCPQKQSGYNSANSASSRQSGNDVSGQS